MQPCLLKHNDCSHNILQRYLPCLFPRESSENTSVCKRFNEIIDIIGASYTKTSEDIH
ncbi:hypothetical protein D3C71_2209370 [compost metagenome]